MQLEPKSDADATCTYHAYRACSHGLSKGGVSSLLGNRPFKHIVFSEVECPRPLRKPLARICLVLFHYQPHTKEPHTRVQAPKEPTIVHIKELWRSQPAYAPAPLFTWGSKEANLRTRQGCHHTRFCSPPHHLRGTPVPASSIKNTC